MRCRCSFWRRLPGRGRADRSRAVARARPACPPAAGIWLVPEPRRRRRDPRCRNLIEREPLAGNALLSLAAIVLAAVPLAAVPKILEGQRRAVREHAGGGRTDLSAPARCRGAVRGRDPAPRRARRRLRARPDEPRADRGRRTDRRLAAAREAGKDHVGLLGERIALDREPSGINAAVREGTAFAVYDAESSEVVNRRLNEIAKVKSCVFILVRAQGERDRRRSGAVAARACSRTRSSRRCSRLRARRALRWSARGRRALGEALERERLIAQISLQLRSHRDEVLPAVLEEIGRAMTAVSCFVRLGEPGEQSAVAAEWNAEESRRSAMRCASVANLAAHTERTVAVADVLAAPELSDTALGDVQELTRLGVRSVLATPILSQTGCSACSSSTALLRATGARRRSRSPRRSPGRPRSPRHVAPAPRERPPPRRAAGPAQGR